LNGVRSLGLALLLVIACATPRLPPPALSVPLDAVRPLLEQLQHEAALRSSIRGSGKIKLRSPSGSGSAREVIVAERPVRLRLETLNILGQTQAVLITDGRRFVYFDGGSIERGTLSDSVLRDRVGLDLTAGEAVEVLLAAPAFELDELRDAIAVGDERWVELEKRRLRIGPDGELRGFEALDQSGAVRWMAGYDQWRDVAGGRYPLVVKLEFPFAAASAELALNEVELNATLDPALFEGPMGKPR
jgi:hypothetical protein